MNQICSWLGGVIYNYDRRILLLETKLSSSGTKQTVAARIHMKMLNTRIQCLNLPGSYILDDFSPSKCIVKKLKICQGNPLGTIIVGLH